MGSAATQVGCVRRTSLSISDVEGRHREVIVGDRSAWSFRVHYHSGDEIVHMLAGRATLRIGQSSRSVEAGETVIVPAGVVHRFEALDEHGWGFVSEFVAPGSDGLGTARIESNLIARIRAMLADRYSLRTDVAQIADACAMSKGYLSRRFRQESGTSLHDFHMLIALHNAKSMLKGGCSIVEAALDAGFYDQAHLTREFVRTYGFTPGVFRAAWQSAPRLPSLTHH